MIFIPDLLSMHLHLQLSVWLLRVLLRLCISRHPPVPVTNHSQLLPAIITHNYPPQLSPQ